MGRLLAFVAMAALSFAAVWCLGAAREGSKQAPARGERMASTSSASARGSSPRHRPPRPTLPAPSPDRRQTSEPLAGIDAAIVRDVRVALARSRAGRELERLLDVAVRSCAPDGIAAAPTELRIEAGLRSAEPVATLTGLTPPLVRQGAPVADATLHCLASAMPAELHVPAGATPFGHYDGPVTYDFTFPGAAAGP